MQPCGASAFVFTTAVGTTRAPRIGNMPLAAFLKNSRLDCLSLSFSSFSFIGNQMISRDYTLQFIFSNKVIKNHAILCPFTPLIYNITQKNPKARWAMGLYSEKNYFQWKNYFLRVSCTWSLGTISSLKT